MCEELENINAELNIEVVDEDGEKYVLGEHGMKEILEALNDNYEDIEILLGYSPVPDGHRLYGKIRNREGRETGEVDLRVKRSGEKFKGDFIINEYAGEPSFYILDRLGFVLKPEDIE